MDGKAYVRTNLFRPEIKKQEIIHKTEGDIPRKFQEWGDILMNPAGECLYDLEIPLHTVGFFEAKAFFLENNSSEPLWPEGDNLHLKVEPVSTITGNSIYSAFVRLFMDNSSLKSLKNNTEKLVRQGGEDFNIIPKSGTFRNLREKVHFIIEELGFDIIMLLPVHPVPTTYARMGIYGSPYAALDFMNVDPALAEFDEKTTPLQQFEELIDEVHAHHARIFIDIPVDHTGWASHLQIHHPDYFERDAEGLFLSPGAWGVTWEDLSKLDFSNKDLWQYLASVFLFWCRRGIDGFRLDAGYMIPEKAWEFIVHAVRTEYPSTIFLLEGLGGPVETTEELLTGYNLNWAYSEMFQNYDQHQMEWYFEEFNRISFTKGPLVNFSETHDNNRLAATSPAFSRLRNGLLALLSDTGTYGISCGVEWFAREKIDVHRLTSLEWGNDNNQVAYIKRLNDILKVHASFLPGSSVTPYHISHDNSIAYLRESPGKEHQLLLLANLSADNNAVIISKTLPKAFLDHQRDILSEKPVKLRETDKGYELSLTPYQVLALCNADFLPGLKQTAVNKRVSELKSRRLLKLQMIRLWQYYGIPFSAEMINEKAAAFLRQPIRFFYENISHRPAVMVWRYPEDLGREFLVPEDTPVLIMAPAQFRYRIECNDKILSNGEGFFIDEGNFVGIVHPGSFHPDPCHFHLNIELYTGKQTLKKTARLFHASGKKLRSLKHAFSYKEIKQDPLLSALLVNRRSGYALFRGKFGEIRSKYDALLAANLNPEVPEDKFIMLTRIRAWSVYKGFSREICAEYQQSFSCDGQSVRYVFEMPAGSGYTIPLHIQFVLDEEENILYTRIHRLNGDTSTTPPGNDPVKIIIRPDIEGRNFHEVTKAYTGPEKQWPGLIEPRNSGFGFRLNRIQLNMECNEGTFEREDEWNYMIHHPMEEERGMDKHSDLFSPGYFKLYLGKDEKTLIQATAAQDVPKSLTESVFSHATTGKDQLPQNRLTDTLRQEILKFIVNRNKNKSVIAGYPWFLDWGRDTLICLRGIISAGFTGEAKQIIKEFAYYEQKGTIPNIIRGKDTSNRNTSDAPLWLFVAARELVAETTPALLEEKCGQRSLKSILRSIASHYMQGTGNGIIMDPSSSLIYSPAHFTWMDTNYPACTPRQGYPVEIQALWYYAISFLAEIYPEERQWTALKDSIQSSMHRYYIVHPSGVRSLEGDFPYLSDCLHAGKYIPAGKAMPDDHIRPNQLFAITLGLIHDEALKQGILLACEKLILPGAIRSLASQAYTHQLHVRHQNRELLNPSNPYRGQYTGDEDTSRKPAYHNGTAWTWPFPSYVEALVDTYGTKAVKPAKDILSTSFKLMNQGCVSQLPEILDGDNPHLQKGCYAQAWGITEFYRIANIIHLF